MKTYACLLLLALAPAACKEVPNPGVCCTTDEDCARLGGILPRGCPDGYACRNLRCEAADCAAAADCSVEQPVCALDSASCTGCTASSDCSGYADAPVCDTATGSCRACVLDAECASEVCDIDTGRCVPESEIIYASPGGSDTAGCTHQQPCSVARAIFVASADPSSSLVRLLPGTYPALLIFRSGVVQVVGTGATIRNPVTPQPVEVHESAVVHIRGLDITGDVSCAGAMNLIPSLTLQDSTVRGGAVIVARGILSMLQSRIDNGSMNVGDDGTFEGDRVYFDGSQYGSFSTSGRRMRIRIANSNFDRFILYMNNQDGLSEMSEYHISFNTLVSDAQVLGCTPGSQRIALFENNIFFSTSPAVTDVIVCSGAFAGNITYPQAQDLGGSNIDQDPRFVDIQGGDLRLQPGSPAVDAAVPSSGPGLDHDFAGTPRPQGARKDIGAFELRP